MKRINLLSLTAAAVLSLTAVSCNTSTGVSSSTEEDRSEEWKALEQPLNFYIANDLGRNGYYDQKPIARTMGEMAETIDIEFVVAAGDVHHFEGVQSVSDPLWMTNYELIYSHPDLMMPWYAICGNHEYRSNTQACIDYSDVSARWHMPSRYYTFVQEEDGVEIRIVMIDTTPIIDKYREETDKYADASKSDYRKQLAWLDRTLSEAGEDWVIVVGHHPVYAYTDKDEIMYVCGHLHTFQHIRKDGSDIDYVVNSSGSLSREVEPIDGTVFCSPESGWSLVTVSADSLCLHMLDKNGKVLTVTRTK